MWILFRRYRAPSRPAPVAWLPARQRTVANADGDERAAIVVDAARAEGYQTVLTSAGFALVNDAGRIVYTLDSH